MKIPFKTIILTAPQGSGKTRDKEALRQQFGCATVRDEWSHSQKLTLGALHLTNDHPMHFTANAFPCPVMSLWGNQTP